MLGAGTQRDRERERVVLACHLMMTLTSLTPVTPTSSTCSSVSLQCRQQLQTDGAYSDWLWSSSFNRLHRQRQWGFFFFQNRVSRLLVSNSVSFSLFWSVSFFANGFSRVLPVSQFRVCFAVTAWCRCMLILFQVILKEKSKVFNCACTVTIALIDTHNYVHMVWRASWRRLSLIGQKTLFVCFCSFVLLGLLLLLVVILLKL